MEGCKFREAALKIHQNFLIDSPAAETPKPTAQTENQETPEVNKPLSFELKCLKQYHPFLLKEKKLTKETINHFGLGFCSKGLLAGWIAIPGHN